MAEIVCNPSNIAAKQAAAVPFQDVLVCDPGDYTVTPRTGLTYRAFDWHQGKPLEGTFGYNGQGYGCRWLTGMGGSFADVKMYGFFYDGRPSNSINYAVLTGDRVELYDFCHTSRVPSGRRQIGFTVGDGPNKHEGFVAERFKINDVGRHGDTHDHPFYIKNGGAGSRIRKGCFVRAGWFAVQLYPEAYDWLLDELAIHGCGGGVVFSSESGNSTVNLNGDTESCRLINSILTGALGRPGGQSGADGYMIESYDAPGTEYGPRGNIVDNVNVYAMGGPSGLIKPGLVGVTVSNVSNYDPGYRDPNNGDFTRTGTWV